MHAEPSEHIPPGELPTRSAWLRFFDTFLQEKNIKWMLGLGGLILFGSSLMLVTSHWQEYTPLWKSLVVMGYTAVLYLLGEIAYEQLGLRRTGTGLLAMTVLLIPVSFLAVRAVHVAGVEANSTVGIIGLLLANTVFAGVAGRRILRHFLRQDQPTFLASYLILSLAGAIVPGLGSPFAIPTALLLWLVFAAGTFKVNRHVFWLGEEHRLPRIFGFFPILLLGTQFITLFAFLAPHIELPWIGFGLVLTAIPVLITADTLAKVFEERTGNLVRPLPWSLVLPLLVGLGLSVAGVCLSWQNFPGSSAAVPTSLLAAMIFVQAARRTKHEGFVWAMWACVVLGYQSSPVFFRELARTAVEQGAVAVSESRLPFAFYGLTYLPLLVAATLIAVVGHRRGRELFARPTERFAIGMTALLWVVSFTHAKAVFPVGLATLLLFGLQMVLLQLSLLRFGLVAAWISLCWGLTPFLATVLHWDLPSETSLWVMTASAALLLLSDRILHRMAGEDQHPAVRVPYVLGRITSLLLTMVLAAVWVTFASGSAQAAFPWSSGMLIAALLFGHGLIWSQTGLSLFALAFAGIYGVLLASSAGVALPVIISSGLLIAGGLWLVAIGLKRVPTLRLSQAYGEATEKFAGALLTAGLFGFTLPRSLEVLAGFPMELWWISVMVPAVWAFDAAWRFKSEAWTIFGSLALLSLTGAVTVTALGRATGWTWLPLVWAMLGLAAVPVCPRPFRWNVEQSDDQPLSPITEYITQPLGQFVMVLFVALAVGTLPFFLLPARMTSLVSLAGLFWLAGDWRNAWLRHTGMVLLNWHFLSGVIQVLVPDASHLLELNRQSLVLVSLPLALAAALSRMLWNLSKRRPGTPLGEWIGFHRLMLLGVASFGLMWSLNLLPFGLPGRYVLLAVSVFAVLAADQIWQAVRNQGENHVWTAEGITALAIGYLLLFEVIHLGSGLSMYAVLLTGWLAWIIGHQVSTRVPWRVLSRPLFLTGYVLPMVTVGVGLVRHFAVPSSLWLGMNSLALLLAAGFYFWRAMEEEQKSFLVLAAVILNVALALLWRELHWHDPQLFAIPMGISILALVEWLKGEIPKTAHDPLRYLGALVILVSPVFHIVGGSWLHLFTLMIASVAVTLTAMGLRVRALMYTGTGFLVGDLLAMVVRGSIDNPTLLWIAGILFGLAVISLAAYCEKHREEVLQRLRLMAARLETWE